MEAGGWVPVVVLVDQVVPGTERNKPGIVGGRWDGDGTGTAHVCVAQLVGE